MVEFAQITGLAPRLAPVDIAEYVIWCSHTGADPADSGSRANYGANLARAGKTVEWPPGRNRPCWCGLRPQIQALLQTRSTQQINPGHRAVWSAY
jgi:hypothetical protein